MLRATFKSLLSRKARLLLSGIAVILGVTFVSGSLVLNSSLGESVRSMFTTVFDDVDVQVSAKSEGSGLGGAAPIPPDAVDEVTQVSGVSDAEGLVQDSTGIVRVVGTNGKVPPMTGAPTVGQNWVEPKDPVELRDGRAPEADDEIVLNAALSDATGYKVGDEVPLITLNPNPAEFTVVGIIGYSGDRDSIAGEQTVMFTMDAARANLMKEPEAFTTISVTAADGVNADELRDDISAVLGSDYKVQTGKDLAQEQTETFQTFLDFFNYLLLGFGAVALIVSIFLIINTFSIIVAQRTRELALFRAMGAGRGQVTGSVMLEALVIGLFSAAIGLGLGIGIGYLGTVLLSDTGGEAMGAELVVPWTAVAAALGVGVGVTMAAAILPALNASRIPPIAALRDAASTARPVRWFAVVGGLLLVGGGALLWAGLSGKFGDGDNRLWAILAAVGLLFIGSAVFTPVIARPLVSVIGMLMSWSIPGKLGRRNSSRNPRRTAITASALMIGIALVTAVGVLFSSAQASIKQYFDTSISADIMIAGQQTGPQPPQFDRSVLSDVRDMPDVQDVAGSYYTEGSINGDQVNMTGVDDAAAYADLMGNTVDKGSLSDFGADDIAVYSQRAKDEGLAVGDTVTAKIGSDKQDRTLEVAAILDAGGEDGNWLVSAENADDFTVTSPIQAYVKLDDGASKKAAIKDINQLLDDNPLVSAGDISGLTDQIGQIFDIILLVVQILLGLAMFIAVIGVVNTLTLSVLERTRELGLLRAVGMTRGQVTRMVTVESVVISLFGALLGVGIGAGLGIAVQQALKDELVDVLAMPWNTMVFYVVAALAIGLLAALIPAYRANKLNVLNAISYE
jgi:putative ABC transport system permease protein